MGWYSNLLGTTLSTFGIGPKATRATLDASALTAARAIVLRDLAGTMALTSDLAGLASRTPAVQSVATAATVTPDAANDGVVITAQAAVLTIANPTGSWSQLMGFVIRIKDNGTARAITFGTNYRATTIALPTTTALGATLYLGFAYNSTDTKFDLVAKA
jgi:hypothetical protein